MSGACVVPRPGRCGSQPRPSRWNCPISLRRNRRAADLPRVHTLVGPLRRAFEGALIGGIGQLGTAMAKDRTPASTESRNPATASPRAEIDAFLGKVRSLGPAVQSGQRGRLIFALDATMSRQPLWDTACRLQGDMFNETASIGGLDVQLVYY